MDEYIDSFIETFFQSAMERHIKEFQQLFNAVPGPFRFIFLAAMKVTLEALLPTLSDSDREIYDGILAGSRTIVVSVPKPREDSDGGD